MKISKTTFEIFKNFTAINNSISVTEPSVLKTLSVAENIIGIFDCEEVFPVWHLYNSVPFMSMANLFDGEVDFDFGEKAVVIKSKGMRTTIVYDDPDIIAKLGNLKHSDTYKKFDKFNANFDLTSDKVGYIQKAANIMGLPDMTIKMTDGKGLITVVDSESPASNNMKIAISGEGDCELSVMVKNIQVASGDYNVSVANGTLSQFKHKKLPLFYVVAGQLGK